MPGFNYRRAPMSAKLAMTCFLILALAGLGIAGLQIYVRAGITAHSTLVHYRGDEATMQYPKSFGELVEITHAHAFTLPLLALVLSAGVIGTTVRDRVKCVVVAALFAGIALELGLPWLVRYGAPWTVHGFELVGLFLGGGLIVAVGVPLYEMWIAPAEP